MERNHPASAPTFNRIGIIGLGYVGLPLSVAFARAGLEVIGVDADPEKVSAISSGNSYIEDVEDETISGFVEKGLFEATSDYSRLADADAVLICLPTPLDEHRVPDLSIVISGAERAAPHISEGTLVVLESTTYPGTTREVLKPIFESGGRVAGEDFFLAFSPERVDPGNTTYGIGDVTKIVGGLTPECGSRAESLYGMVTDVYRVSGPESAELSKLLENIFRGVNIALVNELAILCDRMGVDVWEVVDAAATKPFGFMPFYPGPGLGGHCIPIDPFYLSWRARAFDQTTEFIELAGRINVGMPDYVVDRISHLLNEDGKAVRGSDILLLGVSYKPDVGDLRESPSIRLLEILREFGANVSYHDPHVPELPEYALNSTDLTAELLQEADCVVLATDHSSLDLALIVESAGKVFDLRNALRKRLMKDVRATLPPNVRVL